MPAASFRVTSAVLVTFGFAGGPLGSAVSSGIAERATHKIIQKRLAFRHEQSVTVRAWKARWAFSGFRPAGFMATAGLRW